MEKHVIFSDEDQNTRRARVKQHDKEKGLLQVVHETGAKRGTTEWIDEETVVAVGVFAPVQHDAEGRPVI